ncbi:MAG: T9SS type A sorting domain-containing protein [Bacteroidia bacterium]|nr:T9SS type A sorting domain-containing protein [Bacteroidia bacterium]
MPGTNQCGLSNYFLAGASGSSTTNSISVDYELTAVSGNLVVKGSNACGEGASSNSSITVNPILTAGVSISQDQSGVICAGSGVSFTASPVNGGDSPTYQWAKNGNLISGETNSTFTSQTLNNNDAIVCIITSNAACVTGSPAISDTIFTTVTDPLPLTVNIEANPTGPICEGENVHFVANDINGGNSPTYQWILNGIIISGATDSTYNSSTLVNNDLVTCVVTSNAFCISGSPATSDTITVTVSPSLPADVSIVANPGDIVCVGTLVTFTATPVNGGIPTYQWLKNDTVINGETNADYSSALLSNGDIITCIMTSDSGPCLTGSPATSNPVIITIIQPVTASVSISANPTGAICPGTNVTFTATPVNGGSTPLYQWKKNGTNINGATGSTYSSNSLTNGNSITCLLTSNSFCTLGSPATSNPINMIVTSATVASVSISSSPSGAICAGTNVVFTATPVNGGTAPLYQWKKNGININGATLTTYHSTALTNGNIITCMLTSNATPCLTGSPATSNAVYMTVNPVPAAPVISINGIQLHSNSVVGNQWYLNNSAIMAATGQNYTPVTNGDYSDIVTISGCISDTSNIITITDISIEEISDNNSTIIYPNPTENNITIETLLPIKDFLISVYNIQGQMILQQVTQKQITEINTSRFAKGIYILKLNFNDKIEVTRFVKE